MRRGDYQRVLVDSGLAFAANKASQTLPIQGRVEDRFQIYGFEIVVEYTITEGGGTATSFTFSDEKQRFDLIDDILAGIDLQSTPLGPVIDPAFSTAELIQLWADHLGHFPDGEIWQLPGTTITASGTGTHTGRFRLVVPFTAQTAAIGKSFAPLAGQFLGGGLRLRYGAGAGVTIGTDTWTVSAATFEVAMLGREIKAGGAKVAPLIFVRSSDTGSQVQISGRNGLLFGLSLLDVAGTLVPKDLRDVAGYGYQLKIDGEEYQSQTGSDPECDKLRIIDMGPAPGIYRHVVNNQVEQAYGVPFVGMPRDGAPALLLELRDRAVFQFQSAWGTGQKNFGLVLVPPLDKIGDVASCGCDTASGATQSVAPAGTPAGIAEKYYPRVAG